MNAWQQAVQDFNDKFGILYSRVPTTTVDIVTLESRKQHIQEELNETVKGWLRSDLVEVADGLADLMYVVIQLANTFGLDLDPLFWEVHRSNMTKAWPPGTPLEQKYEGGDVRMRYLKPPTYSPPILGPLITKQIQEKGTKMDACAYCYEMSQKPRLLDGIQMDRVVWEDDDWVVFPTVGSFVEDYLLLAPRDHTFSFAQLEQEEREQLPRVVEWIRGLMLQPSLRHGAVLVAEHGALSCQVKGSQCCDHAHLHFIPLQDEAQMDQICEVYATHSTAPPDFVTDLKRLDLYAKMAYILMSPAPGVWNVWPQERGNFRSQFCRWAAAKALGCEEEYNWRSHPGFERLKTTAIRWKKILTENPMRER